LEVELIPANAVRPAKWRANYVLRPDLKLLKQSLEEYGWIYPIIVRKADSTIIDGFHRWLLYQPDEKVLVLWVDCDEIDAMIMHVRLNRARGEIVNRYLSKLVRRVLRSRKYTDEEVRQKLGMTYDELDVLADGTLLKIKKIAEHKYSKSWVPVETKGREKAAPVPIERPPNPDK
jgi:ParB-like chromosome segregation protein Spo0J